MVVKDEGVQDTDGTVYALEDRRREGEQEGSQESMASFGQVGLTQRCAAAENKEFVRCKSVL